MSPRSAMGAAKRLAGRPLLLGRASASQERAYIEARAVANGIRCGAQRRLNGIASRVKLGKLAAPSWVVSTGPADSVREGRCAAATRAFSGCGVASILEAMDAQLRLVRLTEADSAAAASDISLPQLAHELNSLLDGSIRCLMLAQRALASQVLDGDTGSTMRNLAAAHDGLRSMGEVLRRAMCGGAAALELLSSDRPLGQAVGTIVALVQPLADLHRVELSWVLEPTARDLGAGPLEPVIVNGLRNALVAASCGAEERRVELWIGATDAGWLKIRIADTGPGPGRLAPEQAGHGLGLELCRQIVGDLGGGLDLVAGPDGRGATLRVAVPLRRLQGPPAP
jgi:signal transduction histidine kinase